jgi:hypothetical protein
MATDSRNKKVRVGSRRYPGFLPTTSRELPNGTGKRPKVFCSRRAAQYRGALRTATGTRGGFGCTGENSFDNLRRARPLIKIALFGNLQPRPVGNLEESSARVTGKVMVEGIVVCPQKT